jgi:FkbM family methyltransferase
MSDLISFLPPWFQRFVRRLAIWGRRKKFTRRVTQHRYGSFAPVVELVDDKGEEWYDRDRPFEPEIEILRSRTLVGGACVFEMGAHQGVVALALGHLVGPSGKVVAVEANPFDAHAAARNRELNRMDQVIVLNKAAGARSGMLEFQLSGKVAVGNRALPTLKVDSVSVDDLAAEFGIPAVLFVDVEGYEFEVLKGAARVLARSPDCYVEVHSEWLSQYGASPEEVLAFFPAESYELLASFEETPSRRVFERLDLAKHDLSRGFHLLALSRSGASVPSARGARQRGSPLPKHAPSVAEGSAGPSEVPSEVDTRWGI